MKAFARFACRRCKECDTQSTLGTRGIVFIWGQSEIRPLNASHLLSWLGHSKYNRKNKALAPRVCKFLLLYSSVTHAQERLRYLANIRRLHHKLVSSWSFESPECLTFVLQTDSRSFSFISVQREEHISISSRVQFVASLDCQIVHNVCERNGLFNNYFYKKWKISIIINKRKDRHINC